MTPPRSGEPRATTVSPGVDPCEGMAQPAAGDASDSQHRLCLPTPGIGDRAPVNRGWKPSDPPSPFFARHADALYAACEEAIRSGRIDARSKIGDAVLDYRQERDDIAQRAGQEVLTHEFTFEVVDGDGEPCIRLRWNELSTDMTVSDARALFRNGLLVCDGAARDRGVDLEQRR